MRSNGNGNGNGISGLHSHSHINSYGQSGVHHSNKNEDNGMMEVLLKSPIETSRSATNNRSFGGNGSNSNILTPGLSSSSSNVAGSLPGMRGRTRQSSVGSKCRLY